MVIVHCSIVLSILPSRIPELYIFIFYINILNDNSSNNLHVVLF